MDFIQWNIRGLRANCRDLETLANFHKPSIIALQETLLPADKVYNLNHFVCLSKSATPDLSKRGVALYIHKSILHQNIELQTNLEAVAARITLSKTITVCSLYLSPSSVILKSQLENLITQLPKPFLLLGDFNGHSQQWGSNAVNSRGKIIEDLIAANDLCLLNTGSPTFCSQKGTLTHVDLSISDPSLFLDFEWKVLDDLYGSDHFPIVIGFNQQSEEVSRKVWNFKSANWQLFEQLFVQRLPVNLIDDFEDPMDEFSRILFDCAKEAIPTYEIKPHRVKTPWFDEECKNLRKERKKALRQFIKAPTVENKIKHQAARAKCRFVFKNKKKESWKKFCSNLSFKTDTKKVWDIIKKIKGKANMETNKCLKIGNTIITKEKEVANVLAETIHQNSSSDHYSSEFQAIKKKTELKPISFHKDSTQDYNILFSITELKDAILKSNNSTPGIDEIHYQFLRHMPLNCLNVLLALFNHIWISDYFPSAWTKAVVVPIPKPGKDHSNPSNYRPIALTSCLCKTMERMVYIRLLWKLEQCGALDIHQCGFRKNRSTTDHLVRFEAFVRNALINKDQVVAVLFDLEKAYDTTWKYGILRDLAELDLIGNLPIFIAKFLQNRNFCVRLHTTYSDTFSQEMGVPQGSILSPLLFNLKVNKIVSNVGREIEKYLFVDDFTISARGKTLVGIERQLQLTINRLQNWVLENGFKFSTSKTECIHFHRKRSQVLAPTLILNGQNMKVSRQVKFLGVIFDDKLSFLPHIKYLRKSCQSGLNVLKVISHTEWGADRNTLLRLYRALVRSKLDYGSVVYGSARKSYLQALNPIHNQGLRIALGAFRTSPVESLYAESNEPPLKLRRLKLSMNYYLKLRANPGNPTFEIISNTPYTNLFVQKPKEIPPLNIRVQPSFESANIDVDDIDDNELETIIPSWKLKTPEIDFWLCQYKKDSISCLAFKQLFLEQCEKYSGFIQLFTDGSKKEERSAAACVCNLNYDKSIQLRLPNYSSIFTAELKALQLALQEVERSSRRKFLIISDSLSALMAFENRNISHPFLCDLHDAHTQLLTQGKRIVFMWVPSHVGIHGNHVVDKAAKKALDLELSKEIFQFVPYRDFRSRVHSYCNRLWQIDWSLKVNNKLFRICPNLTNPLPFSGLINRKQESILTRLHIGHSYLTHGWILRKEDPPWCDVCNCQLGISHIFKCKEFSTAKKNYFGNLEMKDILRSLSECKIFDFLKEINLYYKI